MDLELKWLVVMEHYGQYTILGRIGEGAHGIVFKAKHIEVRLLQLSLLSGLIPNQLTAKLMDHNVLYTFVKSIYPIYIIVTLSCILTVFFYSKCHLTRLTL